MSGFLGQKYIFIKFIFAIILTGKTKRRRRLISGPGGAIELIYSCRILKFKGRFAQCGGSFDTSSYPGIFRMPMGGRNESPTVTTQ